MEFSGFDKVCPLCGRPLAEPCNKHHLIPVSKGGAGTTTVLLHKICHDKIHSVISEKDLKKIYNSIERIKEHPFMEKFLMWIKKKPPSFYDGTVKSKKLKK